MAWREEDAEPGAIPVETRSLSGSTQDTECTPNPLISETDIVIIGAGRAGFRLAETLADKNDGLVLYDADPLAPYDRVKLSELLSQDLTEQDLLFRFAPPKEARAELIHKHVLRIDRQRKYVEAEDGSRTYYSRLILCTGSSPLKPPIPGRDLKGVHTFRDLADVRTLIEEAGGAVHAVVIGGGYLGLETAVGLHRRGVKASIVELQNHLMPGVLDAAASARLEARLTDLGIAVHLRCKVASLNGDTEGHVISVRLDGGNVLPANIAVICAGIAPNITLASQAGLEVGRGILVDDHMQTSDPSIYAVGECAEHRGHVYGLTGPALEQAEVLSGILQERSERSYNGSVAASSLKIAGVELFTASLPDAAGAPDNLRKFVYVESDHSVYRSVLLKQDQVVGVIVLGSWAQTYRLRRAMETRQPIRMRDLRRFRRTGQLWKETDRKTVASWPQDAIICNCKLVTKGDIERAIAAGADTAASAARTSGAAQLCGSCKFLVDELVSGKSPSGLAIPKTMLTLSLLALIGGLWIVAAAPWPISQSVATPYPIDRIWQDSTLKQITGFALLAAATSALLLYLRKSSDRLLPGSYSLWRYLHLGLGVLIVALLFAHTGLRFGASFNSWLMLSFTATVLAGAVAGLLTAFDTSLAVRRSGGISPRRVGLWLHILVSWPLPALLGLHILMTYYF